MIIKYNPQTIPVVTPGHAAVRISINSFLINKKACENLGLKAGDKVTIVNDDSAKEWYIIKDPDGFLLRENKGTGSLNFNCRWLAETILKSCKLEHTSYSMRVAASITKIEDKTEAWAILTSTAKK